MPASVTTDGEALEDIVVTAERRSGNLQKTAVSVTALDGAALAEQGRFTIQQILQDVPSVTTYLNAPNSGQTGAPASVPSDNPALSIVIRGVPSQPQPIFGSAPASVAYYADGVYSGIPGDYDIGRVEVLRGPQGTLYGRSATSGVFAVYTRNPVLGEFGGNVLAEAASYDLLHAAGALNIPLGDKLALRVAANHFEEDGQVSREGYRVRSQAARAKLLFQPSDDFSLLLGYALRSDDSNSGGAVVTSIPDVLHSYQLQDGLPIFKNYTRQHQAWAQLDWNLGFASLTYLPSYHTYTTRGSIVAFDGHIEQKRSIPLNRTVTHELRLNSSRESPINWVIGGVYYKNDKRVIRNSVWRVSQAKVAEENIRSSTRDLGVFAEATVPIASNLRLTGGVRYDKTDLEVSETAISNGNRDNPDFDSPTRGLPERLISGTLEGDQGRLTFKNWTYKARVEADLTPRNLLYASVSTAFLPGSVSLNAVTGTVTTTIVPSVLDQQQLTSYEIGSKNRFLDGRLQVNGSVFIYSFAGYQQVVNPDLTNPAYFVTLSSPARMIGGELELDYLPTKADRVRFSFGRTHAKFVHQSADFVRFEAQEIMPSVIPVSASMSYEHSFALNNGSKISIYNQLRYTAPYDQSSLTEQYLPYQAFIRVGDQWVDDLNIRWTSSNSKLSATLYVQNLTNTKYMQNAYLSGINPTIVSFLNSKPRVVGLALNANF